MRWWRTFTGTAEPLDARIARIEATRWVVVDVETGGLDPARDALISIGGVAVRHRRIVVDDSFERVLRQDRASSRPNILIHGIGAQAQREGRDPAEACAAFLDWAGPSVRVGFHAAFDRAFLARASRTWLGFVPNADWLDLAQLAPALNPGVHAKALDEWLEHFGLPAGQRHHASADAFATATLFLRLLAQVPPGERDPERLQRLAAAARFAG